MISKYYEIEKFKNKVNYFLFYGENEGQKQDVIQANFAQFTKENIYKYTEKEIIENKQLFLENIYSKSFFENEKLILISDVSDKILGLIEEIIESNINDHLEFKKAINFLNEIEEKSKFARKRSLQKSVSRGLNRILLERNLGKLKIDLGQKWTLESNNKTLRKDSSGKLDTKSEVDEKRKLKKAEEAMHRLLALNEC